MSKELVVSEARTFLLGGNAEFTIKNLNSGVSHKYRVSRSKKNDKIYFVRVANGNSYEYAGFLSMEDKPFYAKGKNGTLTCDAPAIKGLMYVLRFMAGPLPSPMVMYHHGKCACCGKKLDDPESVVRGFGPVCWKNLGGVK